MKKNLGLIIVCCFMVFIGLCVPTSKVNAGENVKWKALTTQKVIDIDPVYSNNELGMMVHFESGYWCLFWKNQLKGGWPGINEYGTLYTAKQGNKHVYKWEEKKKPKTKIKITPKATPKIIPVVVINRDWITSNTLPEKNKIVVVRFYDDTTSTAYINKYDEWKLDMTRKDYKGGRTLTNVKKWKDIGL